MLTRAQARLRALVVDNVSYRLVLAFQKESETFHGQVKIRFSTESKTDQFLDFTGESILFIYVNG